MSPVRKFIEEVGPSVFLAAFAGFMLATLGAPAWGIFLGFMLTYWATLPRGIR